MSKQLLILLLTAVLFCLLFLLVLTVPKDTPAVTAPSEEAPLFPPSPNSDNPEGATLAERIQPDETGRPDVVIPSAQSPALLDTTPVTVSPGEVLYAYEGMRVENNAGTVYNSGADVYNSGGTVYSSSGSVHNNGGIVYARGGTVYNNGGTVYNKGAEVLVLDNGSYGKSTILGYYELKLADYYEPYVTLEGVTTEPGAEMMIISEDSVCHITAKPGYRISGAESTFGDIIWGEDGSVSLVNVTGDTTLTLSIEPLG